MWSTDQAGHSSNCASMWMLGGETEDHSGMVETLGGEVQMKSGDGVTHLKDHLGHQCNINGVITDQQGMLVKIAALCDCGAHLLLNPDQVDDTEAKL